MQKIMFNDRFLLTDAVLEKRKTQTRRIIKYPQEVRGRQVGYYDYDRRNCRIELMDDDEFSFTPECYVMPRYEVGEIVAVAQSYKNAGIEWVLGDKGNDMNILHKAEELKSWNNKMYVRADLMPHQIKITNVRVQRLQEITDKESLLEGVKRASVGFYIEGLKVRNCEKEAHRETAQGCMKLFLTSRDAYASMIDKLNGKGTWESNPWVFVYDFELVK